MLTTTNGFNGIAVDSLNLYAADYHVLESVPIDGGTVLTLATNSPYMGAIPIVSDGTQLYWSVTSGLQSIVDGGGATVLATGPLPTTIVVDSTYVYWLSNFPQAVARLAKP